MLDEILRLSGLAFEQVYSKLLNEDTWCYLRGGCVCVFFFFSFFLFPFSSMAIPTADGSSWPRGQIIAAAEAYTTATATLDQSHICFLFPFLYF